MAGMKRRDFVKGFAVASATVGTALGQQKAAPKTQSPADSPAIDQGAQAVAPNTASSPTAAARLQQSAQFHTPNIPVTQPDAVATTEQRYFTPARYATLVAFSKVLMPGGEGYPGAIDSGAPEFLDFLIGGSPADRQAMYNNGLDRLQADSMKECKTPFAHADAKQADMVIRPHLRTWINDHPPTEPHLLFVNQVHRDIREATLNSPAYAKAAEAAGERTPGVGLFVSPLDPGIDTWVANGAPKSSAPLSRHAHA